MSTTTANKITKRDKLEAIKAFLETGACELDVATLIEFCDKEMSALDTKAVKAKEYAASKKADGDALAEQVSDALTTEYQTIAEITKAVQVDNAEVTTHMVTYRLASWLSEALPRRLRSPFPVPMARLVRSRHIAWPTLTPTSTRTN